MARITVRLDDTLYDRLLDQAHRTGATPSAYFRDALDLYEGQDSAGYYAQFDELHATAIQTRSILAASVVRRAPDLLEQGTVDARRLSAERGRSISARLGMSILGNDTLGSRTRGGQAGPHYPDNDAALHSDPESAAVIWIGGTIWCGLEHSSTCERFVAMTHRGEAVKSDAPTRFVPISPSSGFRLRRHDRAPGRHNPATPA